MSSKSKNWFARHKVLTGILVVVVLIIIGVAATGSDSGNDNNTTNNESSQEEKEVAGNLKIGESVTMGNLTHVLHSVRWDEGDEFIGPEEGTRWLVADIELKNDGDGSEAISTLLMWKLLDAENRSADVEIGAKTQGSLDGELGAGRTLRGELAYSVSADNDKWELVFEPNVFGFGQAIYTIDTSEIQ